MGRALVRVRIRAGVRRVWWPHESAPPTALYQVWENATGQPVTPTFVTRAALALYLENQGDYLIQHWRRHGMKWAETPTYEQVNAFLHIKNVPGVLKVDKDLLGPYEIALYWHYFPEERERVEDRLRGLAVQAQLAENLR